MELSAEYRVYRWSINPGLVWTCRKVLSTSDTYKVGDATGLYSRHLYGRSRDI